MAQVENWDQAKNEMRDAVAKLFIPIKLIDDNDDPSIPAIFALVGFGLFAASAYLWDQHWSLLFFFSFFNCGLSIGDVSYHCWDVVLMCALF